MQRHYGMDWLRIGAFQLLILYHVGMAFVPWDYQVKVVSPALNWAVVPMLLTNPWRLSLLFVVSGYASAALFAKRPAVGPWLLARAARLGIPLLFGIAVVVTPQPWVWAMTHEGYRHGFGWFLLHDYYRPHLIGHVMVPTYMHLWFVVYLLAYTMVAGALMALPARWRAGLRRGAERALAGPALLPLGIGWIVAARSLSPGWEDSHMLWGDWSAHAAYLPCFLFGWLLARSPALTAAIGRQWRVAGLLAIAGWAVLAWCELRWPGNTPLPGALHLPYRLARGTEAWGAIVGLVGLAEAHWNHDSRWRPMLAEAVFPFYLVHQTIIIVVGWWLLGTDTGPLARFAILVAATAGGCWLFYLGGREIGWLRPLIGLKRVARARASATGAGDVAPHHPWRCGTDHPRGHHA